MALHARRSAPSLWASRPTSARRALAALAGCALWLALPCDASAETFRPEVRVALGLGPALFDDGSVRREGLSVRLSAGAAVRIGPLAGVALRAALVAADLGDASAWVDGRALVVRAGVGSVSGELTIGERARVALGLSLWVGDVQQRATLSPGASVAVTLMAPRSFPGLELATELDVARLPDDRSVPRAGDVLVSLAWMLQYALR